MSHSITLPDPLTGAPVELRVPDDSRWYQSPDCAGIWAYEAIDIWRTRVRFAPDSPTSAAVAAEWWNSVRIAHDIDASYKHVWPESAYESARHEYIRKHDELVRIVDNWRRFTLKPPTPK